LVSAGYAVVGTARSIAPSAERGFLTGPGDIAEPETAQHVVGQALDRFGRIDTLAMGRNGRTGRVAATSSPRPRGRRRSARWSTSAVRPASSKAWLRRSSRWGTNRGASERSASARHEPLDGAGTPGISSALADFDFTARSSPCPSFVRRTAWPAPGTFRHLLGGHVLGSVRGRGVSRFVR
jgi:hypothetical protein